MRITCNIDRTRIIAYLNCGSNFVTLQNLKPEKLIIENHMWSYGKMLFFKDYLKMGKYKKNSEIRGTFS